MPEVLTWISSLANEMSWKCCRKARSVPAKLCNTSHDVDERAWTRHAHAPTKFELTAHGRRRDGYRIRVNANNRNPTSGTSAVNWRDDKFRAGIPRVY